MKDENKSKKQLIKEIADLRKRIVELERSENKYKNTEAALSESENKYRNLVENIEEGIGIVDEQENFVFVNQAAAYIFGYSREELVGKNLREMTTPEEFHRILNQTTIRKNDVSSQYELEIIRKDGERRRLLLTASSMIEDNGRYQGSFGIFQDITEQRKAEEKIQQNLRQLQKILTGTVNALASTVEVRDPYTFGHQKRMTQVACAIVQELGLSEDEVREIHVAGMLHDLGKIYVPAEILNKPSRLTDSEYSIVKTHTTVGYDILKTIEFPWPIADVVLQHHERLNGSGYPYKLKDEEILLEARILAVADVVEAMLSHRPYRPARSLEITLNEIEKNKGILYDPQVVDVCLRLFREKGFKFE